LSVIERDLEIINRLGLHARAAAKLVNTTGSFRAQVTLEREGEVVDGKSILGILLLAAAQGTRLTVRCEGDDEQAAMEAVADLVARKFDEGG
jgi:phosphocarrier protein HPr